VSLIGQGSVARGAIRALQGMGFTRIHAMAACPPETIPHCPPGIHYAALKPDGAGGLLLEDKSGSRPLIDELARSDIVVNAILQNPERPLLYVRNSQRKRLRPGCVIIDISCDKGMGFEFAAPTTFAKPMLTLGHIRYYAVDHTPSVFWESASWEISRALLPFLRIVAQGWAEIEKEPVLSRAIEIRNGVILNPQILSFQKRAKLYPHELRGSGSQQRCKGDSQV
jgi:hypothetical protein